MKEEAIISYDEDGKNPIITGNTKRSQLDFIFLCLIGYWFNDLLIRLKKTQKGQGSAPSLHLCCCLGDQEGTESDKYPLV